MNQIKGILLLVLIMSILLAFYELWDEKRKALNSQPFQVALKAVKDDRQLKAKLGNEIHFEQVIEGSWSNFKTDSVVWYKIEIKSDSVVELVCVRVDEVDGEWIVHDYEILKPETVDLYQFCFVPSGRDLEVKIY